MEAKLALCSYKMKKKAKIALCYSKTRQSFALQLQNEKYGRKGKQSWRFAATK